MSHRNLTLRRLVREGSSTTKATSTSLQPIHSLQRMKGHTCTHTHTHTRYLLCFSCHSLMLSTLKRHSVFVFFLFHSSSAFHGPILSPATSLTHLRKTAHNRDELVLDVPQGSAVIFRRRVRLKYILSVKKNKEGIINLHVFF